MRTKDQDLDCFKKNIHSQFGEDGLIYEVLSRLKRKNKADGWCVEFGAWDGIYLSNTYNLIQNHSYKAVLIEADRDKYKDLCRNIPSKNVYKICKFVNFSGKNSLDNILKNTPITRNFDFLSIDIDGCDYYIFESLTYYKPKLVCIEYNPTIPNDVDYVQEKNMTVKQGSSAKSLVDLAKKKGYTLISLTHCNLFFIRNDFYRSLIKKKKQPLLKMRDDSKLKIYLFSGYDGKILSNKKYINLNWHSIKVSINSIQALPKIMRSYPRDYNRYQKFIYLIYRVFKDPHLMLNKIKKYFN